MAKANALVSVAPEGGAICRVGRSYRESPRDACGARLNNSGMGLRLYRFRLLVGIGQFMPLLALCVALATAVQMLAPDVAIAEGEEPQGIVVRQVDAGGSFTCMLTTERELICAGRNTIGQTYAPSGRDEQVRAGGSHACALSVDGTLSCWDWNAAGHARPPGGSFSQVSAGRFHTYAVDIAGALACWGGNE